MGPRGFGYTWFTLFRMFLGAPRRWWARGIRAAMAFCMAAVIVALPVTAAHAATLHAPPDGTYLYYGHGGQNINIGAVATDGDGRHYYCMETGVLAQYTTGSSVLIADDDYARRLAWLIDEYQHVHDPLSHVAIAVLVHDRYDLAPALWQERRPSVTAAFPALQQRLDELVGQAANSVPAGAIVEQRFAEGVRSGSVRVVVRNAAGDAIAGIPYTVTLNGPARFGANGAISVSGVSIEQGSEHQWEATRRGDVNAGVSSEFKRISHAPSSQDFVTYAGVSSASGTGVNFSVRKDFVPSLSKVADDKIVDPGEQVVDVVTSGVSGQDSHWVPNLQLDARGWYFDGLDAEILQDPITPNNSESIAAFLGRLDALGHEPDAYGTASFTGPGQQVRATAMASIDGSTPYVASGDSGFGTWVWAFDRSEQTAFARDYVLDDAVSPFLEVAETNVNRASVQVQSTVTDHAASVGSELSDTIVVSGFPDGHGQYGGNDTYGYGADRKLSQVRVWWAGDMADPSRDVQYRQDGADEPQEDDHHRLVGQWEYPAVNGTIRVGAGAPDAHGDPVYIEAEHHGWYVFVWSFDGDDRVAPAASAYNDAWEQTRVESFATAVSPSITTQVSDGEVTASESFFDTAEVTGVVEQGAYVEFNAFRVHDSNGQIEIEQILVLREPVPLEPGVAKQTVSSPRTVSQVPGDVYWQAAVVSSAGDVLASHALGLEEEIVTVLPVAQEQALAATGVGLWPVVIAGIALALGGVGIAAFLILHKLAARRRRFAQRG